ncbi:uncharacterized protein LOC124259284 isoform X3 [Haliotis rubra]|uniref:uncharacterized protein LOC124259284 isoform X3 n=1 Tax=Haliotis rubra TaxID=36100 RepID=UPI001EE5ACE2|nr:uncharacterized protein LOC124259284 isoform X3 [Haliotis rubra]
MRTANVTAQITVKRKGVRTINTTTRTSGDVTRVRSSVTEKTFKTQRKNAKPSAPAFTVGGHGSGSGRSTGPIIAIAVTCSIIVMAIVIVVLLCRTQRLHLSYRGVASIQKKAIPSHNSAAMEAILQDLTFLLSVTFIHK